MFESNVTVFLLMVPNLSEIINLNFDSTDTR